MAAKKKPKRKARKASKSNAGKSNAGKRKGKASSGPKPPWGLLGAGVALLAVGGVFAFADRSDADGSDPAEEEIVTVEPPQRSPVTTIPEALTVRVVTRHAHDPEAFTQGLLWHDGHFFESTGLEGRSSLRRVAPNGEVAQRVDVPSRYFAEGLARVGDELFQLTWQEHRAFVYDLETFEKKREFEYRGQGWGLCWDGTHLVMSNGSPTLRFRDPETFEVQREVEVTKIGRPVRNLNELECVDGVVYANVWQRDEIVRIDPATGRVTATIDASGLLTRDERRGTDVLNGIAWLPDSQRFAITGKLWPWVFEVEFVPRE
ncbi:MAG: glutaminyl-peptide cyclotransferase [Myxococcota bacterium]